MAVLAQKIQVISNTKVIDDYYQIDFKSPELASLAKPGQFLMINIHEHNLASLINIPLGVFSYTQETISALYHVIGENTKALSKVQVGEYLSVLGTLGNGFNTKLATQDKRSKILLVAGGCGLAPLNPLIDLFSQNNHFVEVYVGVKTVTDLFHADDIKNKKGVSMFVATMDGSGGYKGIITDLLLSHLEKANYSTDHEYIFSSGPDPMLLVVAQIAKRLNIPAEVSMESYMACGIGACHGCIIKTNTGYKRCCKEGPVFDIHEVIA